MWREAQCTGEVEPPLDAQATRGGDTLVQIVAEHAQGRHQPVIYAQLLSVITYAQKSVDITMAYFVPDDALEKALRDAARRGVAVRIILPSYSDFARRVLRRSRALRRAAGRAACELYELESAFLHSKSIVVDGVWSSIGSTNFDWRSFVHNYEISVVVIDEGFARQMNEAFARDLA